MSDNRRFFVITSQGEVGPFTLEDLKEEVQAQRILKTDRMRTAFGANLGTVGDALAAAPRQKRTTSDRMPPSAEPPPPRQPASVRPPFLAIAVGIVLVLGTGVALLMGRSEPALTKKPDPAHGTIQPPKITAPTTPPSGTTPVRESTTTRGLAFQHHPQAIPGTLEVWRFDEGGESVGYHDATPENSGHADVRPDTGVDLKLAQGWKNPVVMRVHDGEWLNYTCQVASAGRYRWSLLAARDGEKSSDSIGLEMRLDGRLIGTPITVYDTGSFTTFKPFHGIVTLPLGVITLRLRFAGENICLGDISFTKIDDPSQ